MQTSLAAKKHKQEAETPAKSFLPWRLGTSKACLRRAQRNRYFIWRRPPTNLATFRLVGLLDLASIRRLRVLSSVLPPRGLFGLDAYSWKNKT